ncbi:hypothetical protein [Engelhardtia mirabilis]|uniref:Uncharacterized protein n=1 Tax=Engelhardtia mirabilis TaxID=2528011 RepID=A0A518BEJ7_9BACT|nr:hypothetical protein Pla133_04800 [Planctomycetes bacterium Pla133]QDU99741.1 hypothetical protein Pla86_04800 [Planctomycetes bacterium Pla86]
MKDGLDRVDLAEVEAQLRRIEEHLNRLSAHAAGARDRMRASVASIVGVDLGGRTTLAAEQWSRLTETQRDASVGRLTELADELAGLDPAGPLSVRPVPPGITLVAAGAMLVATLAVLSMILGRWHDATARVPLAQVEALESSVDALRAARALEERAMRALAPPDFPDDSSQPPAVAPDAAYSAAHAAVRAAESDVATRTLGLFGDARILPSEALVIEMVMWMGALGGLAHLLTSFAKYVGYRRLQRSWLIYYLFLPIQGAALAVIVYLVLRVGILAPSGLSDGGSANLNLVGIYAFAGLTGLFSKVALDKLAEVFQTAFRTRAVAEDQGEGLAQVQVTAPVRPPEPEPADSAQLVDEVETPDAPEAEGTPSRKRTAKRRASEEKPGS